MPTLVRITCINGNKTETERDVETLVDYRNKSTAAIRNVTLEDKTETERDVGWLELDQDQQHGNKPPLMVTKHKQKETLT